jgi:hypothetical protein
MQKEKRVIWADTYDKDDIKYSFDFSQFSQDWVINRILDIDEGFFLDIGAGVSDLNAEEVIISCMSNTYGLERFRDWNGIAIDYDDVYIREASKFRSCTLVCEDLMKTNINEILKQLGLPAMFSNELLLDPLFKTKNSKLPIATRILKSLTSIDKIYLKHF